MLLIIDTLNRAYEHAAIRSMFEARKRVFIDLLKWDLPALAGRYELDQFDDINAAYLIVTDPDGQHLASARLLPTTEPGLLGGLYPNLVNGPVPEGDEIVEITRFGLSPGIGARQRRAARDTLLIGLAQYALENDITTYTGVAEFAWFRQVQGFGWACRALGETAIHDGRALVGLAIDIDETTIASLSAAGIGKDGADVPAEAA